MEENHLSLWGLTPQEKQEWIDKIEASPENRMYSVFFKGLAKRQLSAFLNALEFGPRDQTTVGCLKHLVYGDLATARRTMAQAGLLFPDWKTEVKPALELLCEWRGQSIDEARDTPGVFEALEVINAAGFEITKRVRQYRRVIREKPASGEALSRELFRDAEEIWMVRKSRNMFSAKLEMMHIPDDTFNSGLSLLKGALWGNDYYFEERDVLSAYPDEDMAVEDYLAFLDQADTWSKHQVARTPDMLRMGITGIVPIESYPVHILDITARRAVRNRPETALNFFRAIREAGLPESSTLKQGDLSGLFMHPDKNLRLGAIDMAVSIFGSSSSVVQTGLGAVAA